MRFNQRDRGGGGQRGTDRRDRQKKVYPYVPAVKGLRESEKQQKYL